MAQYFFTKLIPPRPSFAQDMSDEERRLMGEHGAYWTRLAEEGIALFFGPVADPTGVYGICITQAESAQDIDQLTANDPVIRAGIHFTVETHPMLNAVRGR